MRDDWKVEVVRALGLPTDKTPKWSHEQQEEAYKHAYVLYQKGDYREAAAFYTTLVYSNPFCIRYWKGLAASEQMRNKLQAALHAWGIVAVLNENDPQPHVHAAECLLALKEREEAEKALKNAEERIHKGGRETFQGTINHIKRELTSWETKETK